VNSECLKLSCYFGERHRTAFGFVADQLLDVFGRGELATSIMMRGVEGFGLKHRLRSDTSLTLSEDLPAVAIAVDRRPRIEAVVDEVAAIPAIGLITLERARLLPDGVPQAPVPADPAEATRLTIYLGRHQRVGRTPAFIAVCDLLHRRGLDGATVLLGVDGTVRGTRQRALFFGRNTDVPVMILAVGTAERIAAVIPELDRLLRQPLLTLERLRICKRDGTMLDRMQFLPATDGHGRPLFQKIMIFTSEDATYDGRPIHRQLTRWLRRAGASGSTTLRGTWGFHGQTPPHGDRAFQIGRRVPTLTVVIDTPDRIATVFPIIDELTSERGLVTSELVPAARVRTSDGTIGDLGLADHRW
jgi:PII-like signaling protein